MLTFLSQSTAAAAVLMAIFAIAIKGGDGLILSALCWRAA